MSTLLLVHVEIDDAKPLAPQIAAARAQHVPWKVLEAALGLHRKQMFRLLDYWAMNEFVTDKRAGAAPQCTRSAG